MKAEIRFSVGTLLQKKTESLSFCNYYDSQL